MNSGDAHTNETGVVFDYLSIPKEYHWSRNFVGKVDQYWSAGGWDAGTFCQIYHSTYAESEPNVCTPCQ
jgi:hypothetical protein